MVEALPLLLLSDDGGAATVLSLVPPPLLRRWVVAEVSVMVGRIFYEAVDAAAGSLLSGLLPSPAKSLPRRVSRVSMVGISRPPNLRPSIATVLYSVSSSRSIAGVDALQITCLNVILHFNLR